MQLNYLVIKNVLNLKMFRAVWYITSFFIQEDVSDCVYNLLIYAVVLYLCANKVGCCWNYKQMTSVRPQVQSPIA